MKSKFLILLAFATVTTMAAQAQFSVGPKAGVNITKIAGASFKDKFSYGYHFGGFLQLGTKKKFGFQPEILFSQYTTTIDSAYRNVYNGVFVNNQSKVKFKYLSLPLLLNYNLDGGFLTLQAGPQFSILMDQNKSFLQNGQNAFGKGDFALLGGLQVKILAFRISARYMIGLTNINDIDDKEKWKNQGLQLSVGLGL